MEIDPKLLQRMIDRLMTYRTSLEESISDFNFHYKDNKPLGLLHALDEVNAIFKQLEELTK